MHIFYLREKANVLEAAVLISYYFRRFFCNQVAVNLDPTVRVSVEWKYRRKDFCLLFPAEFIFTSIKTL